MEFAEFARYLERLEMVSSRLEMTRILAELFEKADAEEGRLIAYMSQGRIGPLYDSPDFGVADKQVLKAMKSLSDEDIEKVFREKGDLGQVAQTLAKGREKQMKIREVFERLGEIAKEGGAGSQTRKIELLSDLVIKLSGIEAKYAVKIILGKLRTGFSDMTVLDSLSWMITGDKSMREQIEGIYNVRADLGEIVKLVKSLSSEEIKKIKINPEIGTPVLVARAERAKNVEEIWERNGECAIEHKLDGLRIEAHVRRAGVVLFSRGLENVTEMYPDIVRGLKEQVKTDCILDGEMIAVGKDGKYLPFQETVQRKRKYDIAEMQEKVPLKYFVFDILFKDGVNMTDKTNSRRWEELEKTIKKGDVVKLIPRKMAKSAGDIEKFFRESLEEGTEGIIAKKPDGVYKSGSRDFNWIKYKKSYDKSAISDTIDVVVMGYDTGQGKRSGFGIGDFLVGVFDKKSGKYMTVAKIGTGLTDEEWKKMKSGCDSLRLEEKPDEYEVGKMMETEVWVKPKMVVEIRADEITKSPMHTAGLALRFPRLVAWREKLPEDATNTEELNRLFKLQKK